MEINIIAYSDVFLFNRRIMLYNYFNEKILMLQVFCIIHLNHNKLNSNVVFTFNKVNALRLKFPLILQLSDTISLLQNIDTVTFLVRFIHSATSSVVQDSCNSVNELKCL